MILSLLLLKSGSESSAIARRLLVLPNTQKRAVAVDDEYTLRKVESRLWI